MNYNRRRAQRYADAAKLTGRDFDLDVEAQMATQRSDDDDHWAAQQVVDAPGQSARMPIQTAPPQLGFGTAPYGRHGSPPHDRHPSRKRNGRAAARGAG